MHRQIVTPNQVTDNTLYLDQVGRLHDGSARVKSLENRNEALTDALVRALERIGELVKQEARR